jgi:hypothetical protein
VHGVSLFPYLACPGAYNLEQEKQRLSDLHLEFEALHRQLGEEERILVSDAEAARRALDIARVRHGPPSDKSGRRIRTPAIAGRKLLHLVKSGPTVSNGGLLLEGRGTFMRSSHLVDPILDSAAGGRPNFLTTQWSLVVEASAQGDVASRHALRGEVARTVAAPPEVDEELRYLRTALRG